MPLDKNGYKDHANGPKAPTESLVDPRLCERRSIKLGQSGRTRAVVFRDGPHTSAVQVVIVFVRDGIRVRSGPLHDPVGQPVIRLVVCLGGIELE
jgi:hypothetical protein